MEKCENEGFPYGSWLNGGLLLKPKPPPGCLVELPQATAMEVNSGERMEAQHLSSIATSKKAQEGKIRYAFSGETMMLNTLQIGNSSDKQVRLSSSNQDPPLARTPTRPPVMVAGHWLSQEPIIMSSEDMTFDADNLAMDMDPMEAHLVSN